MSKDWVTQFRPGYLGKKRNEVFAKWDTKYGKGKWRLAWIFGSACLDFLGVCRVYEDAYFEFLRNNQNILEELIREASDVYDDAPSNVASGLNYLAQETNRTHVQDIAIRSCLSRMGLSFRGSNLIQIRDKLGTHPLRITLSPGQVPFHMPEFINCPRLTGWWLPDSVEDFYQNNKYLQTLA